ncbi:amino acid transporter [Myriangium duriaei CBS 260.36]|uniref:Amino acid transporter n=1 Tax=Myriangium duriaei CBS 260.36 TaxID=1168546 RepID=A0A9P4IYB9_9PEZI|nr:amino acid transporter [Myriangium duriaei CBS 260.36]
MSSDSSPIFGGGNTHTVATVYHAKNETKQTTHATFDSEKTEDADSLGCVAADREDMRRLGKKQEFKRVFRTVTLLSFTTIGQVAWQYSLLSNTQALTDGGRAGIVWSLVWTFAGFILISLSLSEMASIAPTAGGQYHWVSEFAPRTQQRLASYICGWMLFLRWQAGQAGGTFIMGTLIQAMLVIRDSSYTPKGWQGFLFVVPFSILSAALSIRITTGHLTVFNMSMVVHVLSCFTTVVVVWVLAPHVPANAALATFTNNGGWSTTGLSLMIGQVSMVATLGGFDAAIHMAEEVRNANIVVPKVMFRSLLINGSLALLATVMFAFSLPNITAAIADATGYPYLAILRDTTSKGGIYVLTVLLMILLMASSVTFLVTTARATFAFARDGGLPFSKWIAKVDPRTRSPINAIILSTVITNLLSIIYVGSPAAYNAILSVGASGQLASYGLTITYMAWRRWSAPETIPRPKWSLGRYGMVINVVAAAYSWTVFVWSFWPAVVHPNAQQFNWASVVFVGVLVLAIAYYNLNGKTRYTGPVVLTSKN